LIKKNKVRKSIARKNNKMRMRRKKKKKKKLQMNYRVGESGEHISQTL
jgi:hypothetical protein